MRCKPGDLAFIVGGRLAENAGLLVEVLRPARESDGVELTDEFCWWCRSLGRPIRHNRNGAPRDKWTPEYAVRDQVLRPLRDGPDAEVRVKAIETEGEP